MEKEKLCPFKKTLDRDYNGMTGKHTVHERFEVCAGERCMAYAKGRCLRLESMDKMPIDRRRER